MSTNKRLSLSRSIYVSRLQPNVTTDNIISFIKNKIPDLDSNDVHLRLLVKKDRNVEDLNFVSYRLGCTEILYTQLMNPAFWPSHVMIRDFVERQSEKQASVDDFLSIQQSQPSVMLATPTTPTLPLTSNASTDRPSITPTTKEISTMEQRKCRKLQRCSHFADFW